MPKNNNINELDFETAMKKLDQIVAELSSNDIELDRALKVYEEGVALIRACNAKLEDAQRKISVIKMSDEGEVQKLPLNTAQIDEF